MDMNINKQSVVDASIIYLYVKFEKFNEAYQECVDGMLQLMDDPYSFEKSGGKYNQVVELLLEDKKNMIHQLSLVMKRALLLSQDGAQNGAQDVAQNKYVIYTFFTFFDTDGDGYIMSVELKNFIMKAKDKFKQRCILFFGMLIVLFTFSSTLKDGQTCLDNHNCDSDLHCEACVAYGNIRPRCTLIQPLNPIFKVKGLSFNHDSWLRTHNGFARLGEKLL